MKKFLSLLLVFVMLLGVLCSCNDTNKNTNIPSDDANTPNSEDKPSEEENKPSDEENPNDETNKPSDDDPDTIPDTIPDIIITDPNGDIGKASNIRGDGEVVFGKTGERALYVKSWDKSFPLPNDCNVEDCLIVEDYMWVVLFDYGNDTSTTMKISRKGEALESYNYTFPFKTCYDESTSDSWVFNCYSEDCFYAFYVSASSKVDEESKHSYYYSVTTFKSYDCGKTWTKEPGIQAGIPHWHCSLDIFKFVSREVGFIVYYDTRADYENFAIYATTNGGETWNYQSFNIKDNSEEYYSCFQKLQATEDGYVAVIKVYPILPDRWDYENMETLKYFSSDLKTWTLLEESEPDEDAPDSEEGIETIARENNYHLYRITGTFEYGCEVYDSEGNIVFSKRTTKPLTVSMLDDDLIEIRIGYGTGYVGRYYFSIKKDKLSSEFLYVVAVSGSRVAYLSGDLEQRKLIVADIYGLNNFVSFELDFAHDHTPVTSAEFSADGSSLSVTYIQNYTEALVQKTLDIPDTLEYQSTSSYSTNKIISMLNLPDTMASALKNEIAVYSALEDAYVYLSDWFGLRVSSYVCAVDLDNDGKNETLVMERGDRVIILREYDGTVYAWQYRHTALYYLRVDGTYAWNKQAGQVYGSSKLQFDGASRNDVELDRVEYEEKFYINDAEVSAEKFKEYHDTAERAEKAARYLWKTSFEYPDDAPDGK